MKEMDNQAKEAERMFIADQNDKDREVKYAEIDQKREAVIVKESNSINKEMVKMDADRDGIDDRIKAWLIGNNCKFYTLIDFIMHLPQKKTHMLIHIILV